MENHRTPPNNAGVNAGAGWLRPVGLGASTLRPPWRVGGLSARSIVLLSLGFLLLANVSIIRYLLPSVV